MSDLPETDPPIPTVEVPRPDIAPPPKAKRGRKPLPRDDSGNIVRDPELAKAAKLSGELKRRLPGQPELLTDEKVGKAIAGAFGVLGLFRGPHWRLFPQEEAEYGAIFGPLARLYGPEELGRVITLLTCLPVIATTLGPRIAIERGIMTGKLEKKDGRIHLLALRGMMEAEKQLDLAKQVKEAAAFQRVIVQNGIEMQVDNSAKEEKADGVVQ